MLLGGKRFQFLHRGVKFRTIVNLSKLRFKDERDETFHQENRLWVFSFLTEETGLSEIFREFSDISKTKFGSGNYNLFEWEFMSRVNVSCKSFYFLVFVLVNS